MAETLTVNSIKATFDFKYESSVDLANATKNASVITWKDSLSNGTAVDNADLLWFDERSLSSGANETLDLHGSLTNVFGTTVSFARVKLLALRLTTTTTGCSLTVGNAASNQFSSHLGGTTQTFVVRGGGWAIFYTPDATAYAAGSSADQLKLTASAHAITYQIVVIGASA